MIPGFRRSSRSFTALTFTILCSVAAAAHAQDAPTPPPVQTPDPQPAAHSKSHQPASFFKALGHDVINLGSTQTLLILGIGGAGALAVSPADSQLTRMAADSGPVEETFDPGQVVGSGWTQAGGALGTLVIGHFVSPKAERIGSELLQAQIINVALTQGLKFAVNRPRPDGSPYSFPSGHASSTFATAMVLQRELGWKVGLAAYGLAAYASTSRLSENKHYASDVVFGAAIGMVAGRCVTVGQGNHRFAVGPSVVRGGVALTFTHIER